MSECNVLVRKRKENDTTTITFTAWIYFQIHRGLITRLYVTLHYY